jgi:uncharacterized membrane protein
MPKFCTSCGAPLKPQARFCGECGEPTGPAGPPPEKPAFSSGLGLSDNGAATLAYALGFITGIVFLVLEPHSRNRTVRFHALQSIYFNVAWVVLYVVLVAISLLIATLMPFAALGFGALMMILNVVLWLGGLALWVVLMVKAYQGQRLKLPIVGRLAEKHADRGQAPSAAGSAEEAAAPPPPSPPPPSSAPAEPVPPGVVQTTAPLGPEPEEAEEPPEPPPAAEPPEDQPPPEEPPSAEAAPPEPPAEEPPPKEQPPPPEDADTDKDIKG